MWDSCFLLDFLFSVECASVLADHTHLLPTESGVLDRHADQRVLVFLVVATKSVLVELYLFCVIRARFRELRKFLSDGRDQAGLSLHSLFIGHGAMRIADPDRAFCLKEDYRKRDRPKQFDRSGRR